MTTNSSPTPGHPPIGFSFRNVNEFTPNLGQWSPVGDITSWARTGDAIRLNMFVPGLGLLVSFLGPRCFRVRFRPVADANYTTETSPAVVERDLGPFRLTVQDGGDHVTADTGDMTVRIDLKPYRIQVFRGRQLISADAPNYNLVYFPSEEGSRQFQDPPGERAVLWVRLQGGRPTVQEPDHDDFL